jgi:hypothetical protein
MMVGTAVAVESGDGSEVSKGQTQKHGALQDRHCWAARIASVGRQRAAAGWAGREQEGTHGEQPA